MQPTLVTCPSCGNNFTGNYCNHCGEKLITEHDKKLSHVFEEALHFITHFDSKFLTTVKLVLTRTGFVSKEYCAGRRKKYFKPISLFLISVVVYLLVPALPAGMNIRFESQIS